MRRFGPGLLTFVGALVGLGFLFVFLRFRDTDPESWKALLAGTVILLGTVPGWSWYRVDAEGIHRWGLSGSKFVPWDAVDTVRGRRIERTDRAGSAVSQVVVDADGRTLLRLGPWIHRRRELARLIRTTAAARRDDEAAGDP